jgi:hypothetical protein
MWRIMTARLSIFVYLSVICHIVNANVAYKTTSNILEVAARLGATKFLELVNVTGFSSNLTQHGES